MKFIIFIVGFLIMFFALNASMGNILFIFLFGVGTGIYFREFINER